MSRLLLIAASGVLTLALANPATAHGPSRSFGSSHVSVYHGGPTRTFVSNTSYLSTHGTKFSHGYYFGRNNFYWSSRYWSSRYGCYCYWNPYASCYYYWYAPQSCYYPISYITVAPPTVVVTPPTVTVTTPPTVAVTAPATVGLAGAGSAPMPPAPPVP
jgi:hypothetical protein